jgi:TolA-binding protein
MKKFIIIFLSCFLLLISYLPVYAYWIWKPKTGKWINPKWQIKPTPKEQLDYALDFYNQKNYGEALREFKKLINKYPKSYEASEAQFYIGACLRIKGNSMRHTKLIRR